MAYKPKSHKNVITWTDGDDTIQVSITQKKVQNRIRKYSQERPEEVFITAENPDGSMEATLPYECLRLTLWKRCEDKIGKQWGTPFEAGHNRN